MISRKIQLPKNQSFFLFGPRQTGKSTLLRSLFAPAHTITYDLLKSEEYLRFSEHPELLRAEVQARKPTVTHIIIDEVQRIPALLNEVHWLIEQPNAPFFILTGSSARKLKRSEANLLAGRALTYQLFPLTTEELGPQFSLMRALQFGTIPSIYIENDDEVAIDRLHAYVDTYLKEEIEREAQIRGIAPFMRFLTLAAMENGNQINYSNIARQAGISYQTIKSYFQVLEDTLIGQFLFPYLKSQRQRLTKHPKFYFFDTGVVRALTKKLRVPLQPGTAEFGSAFEHFVILETMRLARYHKRDYLFSYYRSSTGVEIDLIIETPRGKTIAVEIKSSDNIDGTDLRHLRSFGKQYPEAVLYCVSRVPHKRVLDSISILPWQDFFQEIITL
ncbi:MAG: ATP-binding protein [Candidatus Kerfeldbacteria bacterium]|nr:ATP-binding protein [Candidatus Kerfeldbacteria bacterium]